MNHNAKACQLARLFGLPLGEGEESGQTVPSLIEFTRVLDQWQSARGIGRPCVPLEDEEPEPKHLLYWLLRMALATYERLVTPLPPVNAKLIEGFGQLVQERPQELEDHAQLHIDVESTLRRALVIQAALNVHPGPVLAVGDDDEVTLALALLGVQNLCAVDIDERLLAHIADQSDRLGCPVQVGCVDVFEDPVPTPWRGTFSAVITDPIRSHEPCMAFLNYAAAALQGGAGAGIFWADHPDWNYEYTAVLDSLAIRGLTVVTTHPLLHAYPVTDTWLPDLEGKAVALGLDPGWFRTLTDSVQGWSHLHQVRR